MDPTMTTPVSRSTSQKITRRKAISGLLAGAFATATPLVRAASSVAEVKDCLLPTAADALQLYIEFLRTNGFAYNILRPYFFITSELSSQLAKKYAALKVNVVLLQDLVPELKVDPGFCQLRDASGSGKTSALGLATALPQTSGVVYAHVAAFSSLASGMAYSASSWTGKEEGIVLSEAAVRKLKEILCNIDDLQRPTGALQKAATALTTADREIKEQTEKLTGSLREAIKILVSGELGQIEKTVAESRALAIIDSVIANSRDLKVYKVPPELQSYLDDYMKSHSIADNPSETGDNVDGFREFLTGVKAWIKLDDEDSRLQRHLDGSGTVVMASYNAGLAYLSIIRDIQAILAKYLPEGTSVRAWYCYARVKAFFFMGYDEATRLAKIVGLLRYLYPRGEKDNDSDARIAAARELNNLPFD
jgi:hypothetical protein